MADLNMEGETDDQAHPEPAEVQKINGHTMIFVQFGSNEESRTYMDCPDQEAAIEAIIRIFEQALLKKNNLLSQPEGSDTTKIHYTLEDMTKFVDQIFDLGMLVFNENVSGYTAHGKSWVKAKMHAYIRRQAPDE